MNQAQMMRYERLAVWAQAEWQRRYGDSAYKLLWTSESCGNQLAQSRIKPRRRLKGSVYYTGVEQIPCGEVISISEYVIPGRKVVLGETVGAFRFSFIHTSGAFDVLYVSSYYRDDDPNIVSVALIPPDRLDAWVNFEALCNEAVRRPTRRQDVYIVGGTNAYFKPTVDWDEVILPNSIKDDLRSDMEAFFKDGVKIYRELNLAPFRKLLLVGPPGTGKTMLCSAMAKLALQKKRVVVYVSGADDDGASFHKIHHALNVVATAGYPVLLIVEEIDVYLRKDDKARILNVLDGLESPNNGRGALLLATTNYPEVIDERIAKRPGRMDRIITIPTIQDEDVAFEMLHHYMGAQWHEEHAAVVPFLVGQTGAFVREIALHARMLAAHNHQRAVDLNTLQQSVDSLSNQLRTGDNLLPRRNIGFEADNNGSGSYDVPEEEESFPVGSASEDGLD
ncbi:AAA family ATPase [Aggregatilinea lenta]|uniref:AAA family ATPase n=1 Tax=Aggregatilinea lenta TaxID=913108 RepID=UPI0013C31727|nr:ATP-binding protein [Aggregatilinea lenta]